MSRLRNVKRRRPLAAKERGPGNRAPIGPRLLMKCRGCGLVCPEARRCPECETEIECGRIVHASTVLDSICPDEEKGTIVGHDPEEIERAAEYRSNAASRREALASERGEA